MKSHGYGTFFAGKWHLGGDGFTPEEQGYDVNVGGYHFGTPPGGYHSPYRNPKLSDDEPGAELPIRLGSETANYISEQAASGKPFFAMLSFYSVHGPIQCSKDRWMKFRSKADRMGLTQRTDSRFRFDRLKEVRQVQDHPVYAGMMAALDDAVGLVLQAIEQSKISDETVVIFTSDNGGVSSGDGFATSALPMRGGKGRQWEGGIRQPYYVYWPGVTNGGRNETDMVTGTDFYPTILEIAGLPSMPEQHRDGVSLVPALKGQAMPARPLFWHYPHYGNQGGEPSTIMIDGQWKLIHYHEDDRTELYDLTDITERNDLSANNPERVQQMMTSMQNWRVSVHAAMPRPNPNYDDSKALAALKSIRTNAMIRREKEHARFLESNFQPKGGWWDLKGKPSIVD